MWKSARRSYYVPTSTPVDASGPHDDPAVIESLRHDVEALVSLDRRTTTAGERRAARWIATRLEEIGARDIEVQSFRGQSSWAPANLGHVAAGMATSALPRPAGTFAAAAVAVSYELDVSGRFPWLRRVLPSGTGASVVARVPAKNQPVRTVVLVAHHDAAHNGLVWHPRTVAANRAWSKRTGRTLPSHVPVLAGLAAMAAPNRWVRRTGVGYLAILAAAMVQSMRSSTTPGANDNATGVATVLELARRYAVEPLSNTEILLVFPGGEEAGNVGMRAWAHSTRGRLHTAETLVLNLDSLGSGGQLVLARQEGLTSRLPACDLDFATGVASKSGIALRTVVFPNVCDATLARYEGMHAMTILSYEDGWINNLHLASDTGEEIRWNTVVDALALAGNMASEWNQAVPHGH